MVSSALSELVIGALDDLKGQSIKCMDVRHLTSVTDVMVIVTGRSDRHVRALAESIVESCKRAGERPLGVEGQDAGDKMMDYIDRGIHIVLEFGRQTSMLAYLLVANIISRRIHEQYVRKSELFYASQDSKDETS